MRCCLSFAALTLCLASASAAGPETTRPNFLWLIAEDFGPHLSCCGTKEVWTPNLDKLAAEGVRYTRCFTTAPVCSPSRSAFMTGMYQTTIGAHHHRSHRDDGYRLPDGVRVATDWMREAGYFTANIRTFPREVGFNGTAKTDWNFTYVGQPFDSDRWEDLKAHQPFFAQVNFKETHRPFVSPRRADPAKVEIPPYYPDHPVTRADWAKYLDAATELDGKVAKILQELERDGLADNTVILFFGDHGQAHVRGKQFCYDSGLNTPLIIHWPKRFPTPRNFQPSTVDDRLIAAIDFLPTMLAIAGAAKPDKMQGEVFLGDRATPPRQYVFGARDRCDETVAHFRTVRDVRYRYIRNFMPERPFLQPNAYKERSYPVWNLLKELQAKGKLTPVQAFLTAPHMPPEELYDLQNDPHEINNLAGSPDSEHQAALARLRVVLEKWITDTNDQGRIPEPPDVAAAKGATRPGTDPNAPAIIRQKPVPQEQPAKAQPQAADEPPTEWIEPLTGHRVVRLSREPGTSSFYFHQNAYTAAGDKIVVSTREGLATIHLQTRQTDLLGVTRAGQVVVGKKSRQVFYTRDGTVYAAHLDTHATREIAKLPPEIRGGSGLAVNADETLLAGSYVEGAQRRPVAGAGLEARWAAHLPMRLYTVDVKTGALKTFHPGTEWLNHVQFSPTDPTLLMFCHEGPWHKVDRIWTIRTDGTDLQKIHTRALDMEIAGHEFFSPDGKVIWYDLQTPKGKEFWLAGQVLATGEKMRYRVKREEWSVHFNASPDGKLFAGDGGGPRSVAAPGNGQWIYLFTPKDGLLQAEKLVDLAKHDYRLEPNVTFTPDGKWIVFRSNMHGPTHVYAVEVSKAHEP